MKGIICFILVSVLMFALASCSVDENVASSDMTSEVSEPAESGKPLLMYNDISLPDGLFAYALSVSRATTEAEFKYYGSLYGNEYGWATVCDDVTGKTFEEAVENDTLETVKRLFAVKIMNLDFKLKLTDDVTAGIINTKIDLVTAAGGDAGYDAFLASIGATDADIGEYYELLELSEELKLHLYGSEGVRKITDEQAKEYITDYYLNLSIAFYTASDEAEGKAEQALAKLTTGGMTFEELNSDSAIKPDGYTVTTVSSDGDLNVVMNKAIELEYGETALIKESDGVYVIRRNELPESTYNRYLSAAKKSVADKEFEKLLADYTEEMKLDLDKYSLYDIKTIRYIAG